ncbi:MAG: 2'-5' RNA ligase family protein [Acidobacteria bacterium]|nr:2'-5' RNA ligase family protein [Acidobacteriota bacterium]
MDGDLEKIAKLFGVQPAKTPKQPKTDSAQVAHVVNDELNNLGWSEPARLSFLGDLGRENAWNRDTIFQGHKDPKNNANNLGIVSYQGSRRTNLINYLGGDLTPSDDNLRKMVRFMDKEMQSSPEWRSVHRAMRNPNISTYDASENLRKYIKYVPNGPYNSYDSNFRVKNNRDWAEKARSLGLVSSQSAPSSNLSEIANYFNNDTAEADSNLSDIANYFQEKNAGGGNSAPENVARQNDNKTSKIADIASYFDVQPSSTIPAPQIPEGVLAETPEKARLAAGGYIDEQSPRVAVLLTDKGQSYKVAKTGSNFVSVNTPNGELLVNARKAKTALGLNSKQEIETYVRTKGFASLIGKVEDVGGDTASGAAVRTESADGKELSTSVVTTPETATAQIQNDQKEFGARIGKQEILPTQTAVQKRQIEQLPADYAEFLKASETVDSQEARNQYSDLMRNAPEAFKPVPNAVQPQPLAHNKPAFATNIGAIAPNIEEGAARIPLQPRMQSPTNFASANDVSLQSETFGSVAVDGKYQKKPTVEEIRTKAQSQLYGSNFGRANEVYQRLTGEPLEKANITDDTIDRHYDEKTKTISGLDYFGNAKVKRVVDAYNRGGEEAVQRVLDSPEQTRKEIEQPERDAENTARIEIENEKRRDMLTEGGDLSWASLDGLSARFGHFINKTKLDDLAFTGVAGAMFGKSDAAKNLFLSKEESRRAVEDAAQEEIAQAGSASEARRLQKEYEQMSGIEKATRHTIDLQNAIRRFPASLARTAQWAEDVIHYARENGVVIPTLTTSDVLNGVDWVVSKISGTESTTKFKSGYVPALLADAIEKQFPDDPLTRRTTLGKISRAVGSAVPFLIGAVASGGSSAVVALLGIGSSVGEQYSAAEKAGLSREKQLLSGLSGVPFGLMELGGLKFAKLGQLLNGRSNGVFVKSFMDFLQQTGKEATEETLQEFTQSASGKLVIEGLKKDGLTRDDVAKAIGSSLEDAFTGGIVGAIFGGSGAAISGASGRKPVVNTETAIERSVPRTWDAEGEVVADDTPAAQNTPVSPQQTENIIASTPPRELLGENPKRIETAQPDAVQKAAIDTRVQKVVENLKGKPAVSIEQLQKSTRYNKTNVEDAVMLLYAAKQVEILPDNSVRFIGGETAKAEKSLFERAAEIEHPKEVARLEKSPIENEINAKTNSIQSEYETPKQANNSQSNNDLIKDETKTKHDYSSTQVNLPEDVSSKVLSVGKTLVKDADLADKIDWNPRETEPHITVKYGLHTNDAKEVRQILAGEKPFEVTLGKTSIFPAKEDANYDVVKVDIDSPELHRINKLIADNTKVTDTHPTYNPHVTLAYVKAGQGQKYADDNSLEGTRLTFNSIAFSDKNGNQVDIPLGKDVQSNKEIESVGGIKRSDESHAALKEAFALPFITGGRKLNAVLLNRKVTVKFLNPAGRVLTKTMTAAKRQEQLQKRHAQLEKLLDYIKDGSPNLVEGIKKLGKQIGSVEREELEARFDNYRSKGLSEYEASVSALTDFHKNLFDAVNDLRSQVRLKAVEYKPFDSSEINAKYKKNENSSDPLEDATRQSYKNLPEQRRQTLAPEKPIAKVITAARPNLGEKLNVFTERGTKASIEPKVVDASEILTSFNEGYPSEFQPKDTNRIASKELITRISNNPRPEFLGDSQKASDGRPLAAAAEVEETNEKGETEKKIKYIIISGNHRAEGVKQSYANGKASDYADFARSKDPSAKHAEPIYISVLDPNEIDLATFAREANESGVAKMSATEQAKIDADRLSKDLLNKFVPSEDGSIHSAANRDFVRGFMETVETSVG